MENNNMSFEKQSKRWLKEKKKVVKQTSYDRYKSGVEYLLGFFKANNWNDINDVDVEKLKEHLAVTQGLAQTSQRNILVIFAMISKWSQAEDLACTNMNNCKQTDISILSDEDISKIKNELNEEKKLCNIGIQIALYTGIRIGELVALKWEDFDWENSMITINKTASRIKTKEKEEAKTKVIISEITERKIPISSQLAKLVEQYKKQKGYVLTCSDKPYETRSIQLYLKNSMNNLGVPDVNFSCLRDTFAVRAVSVGMRLDILKDILGLDNETSLKKYIKYYKDEIEVDRNKIALAQMEKIFF